ncbi:helix-turn-helix transcriptional regulator [Kribbella qitaiheensis]|uniref:Helix-turn-helix transcriptional regulator n=1 Tax=Kribbella qitaiheensis TaxID=1544730 RepID=A0A7G6WVR6_9ACTN|nr:helix-turn-helix transcriptional regulator [Kribbella qitaiheensis]QNE18081.1 helix-turn-helix transcriptional regulator [Kribbella qitaiheensis]
MTTLPSDTFARRAREERERQRMSQEKLAKGMSEELGITIYQTAVTRIEQQTRAIQLDEAVAIATVLNVPLAALLSEQSVEENDALKQQYLAELAAELHQWEQSRQTIGRLTRLVQSLSWPREADGR